ncbi:MAG: ribonuclease P protein component [Actinobacteria bacterium]|nr:ribonuclease P protein component [Actinomycetota bacterium]
MIWRIRERSTFTHLAKQGRRARAGVLWCTYSLDLPNTETPPRVAFAFGRAFGPAVVRNRARRQLRAMLRVAAANGLLPSGAYLFGGQATAAGRSSVELQFDLDRLLALLHP